MSLEKDFAVDSEEDLESYLAMDSMVTALVQSFVLKAVVSLGIPDIIAKAGKPLSLEEIISQIPSPVANPNALYRLLCSLVRSKVLAENPAAHFGLTKYSRWLVKDNPLSIAPKLIISTTPEVQSGWQVLDKVVLQGGSGFKIANGMHFYELACSDPVFNKALNDGMASFSAFTMALVVKSYMGFKSVSTLVDVGGGSGKCLSKIVQAYPHIKGTVYDLPHVISDAPKTSGIEYVSGDMFESVPSANALFLKSIFHNWDDEKCKQILQSCYKALPANGRLIIVDMIKNPKGSVLDVGMMVFVEGKERSEEEWEKLLVAEGFSNIKFTHLPSEEGIIEASKP